MGKQKLKGKGRREKYFYLAKEVGYRARSSFKLIQLNKKFNFLQESKVLVDLCAAPGSWLQVAAENMPVQSIILGVDLDEIKPLRGVQTFKDDITTDSCRNKIKAELHGWSVDTFLHDGAPNVGKNWLHDAFQQSVLTLHALKLASTFLRKGGWFVTKVFRSKDYQALLWVFNQLFHKVHSTKPSASRDQSAEIFVVCQKFKFDSIKKIDKKFFEPKYVFEEVEERHKAVTVMDFEPKKRKAKGYADEFQDMVYEKATIEDFLASTQPLSFLKKATKVVLADEGDVERQKELQLDDDMLECLKDTKQCGKREVKQIIKWHAKTRKRLGLEIEEEDADDEEEEEELDSDEEMQKLVEKAEEEEAREKRRKRKETHKKKQKINARRQNVKHSGLVEDASEMFDLNQVKSKDDLGEMESGEMDDEHPETEDEEEQQQVVEEEMSDSDDDEEEDDEIEEESSSEEEEEEEEVEENPLLIKEKKVGVDDRWFENSAFDGIEDEADDIAQAAKYYQQKEKALMAETPSNAQQVAVPAKKRAGNTEYYSDGSDSEYELLQQSGGGVDAKKIKLDPEALALGTAIATSNKSKMAMIDGSFNRYMFDDDQNVLPDWFVESEGKRIVRTNLDEHVDKELVNHYKMQGRNINDRTIKKVVEAKFRKRYHHMKKLEKANKQASSITDSTDMSNKEKAVQLKALYKKSGLSKKKEHTTYVFARKGMGARVRRPAGVQGRFKVVDKRMKKELRVKKKKAAK